MAEIDAVRLAPAGVQRLPEGSRRSPPPFGTRAVGPVHPGSAALQRGALHDLRVVLAADDVFPAIDARRAVIDRKSFVWGKSVSVRVNQGLQRYHKKKSRQT